MYLLELPELQKKESFQKCQKEMMDLENPANNTILSKELSLNLDSKKTSVNNNVMIIGGAGSGASRSFIIPNILQCNSSFVINDPDGTYLRSTRFLLKKNGYNIKVFNLGNPDHSNHYNFFDHIKTEVDVMTASKCIVRTIRVLPPDSFRAKATESLLNVLLLYVKDSPDISEKDKTFEKVYELLAPAKENINAFIDDFSKKMAAKTGLAKAAQNTYLISGKKDMLSSAIMAACQIKTFCTDKTKRLCSHTDIDFTELGKKKTALFIIDPESEGYYAPVISLLHQHIVKTLYKDLENREASIHVRFIMNKIPIYGTTPELPFYLATMRSLNISCSLIFQTIEQLKSEFPTNQKDILGNCGTLLFLGTNDLDTARHMYCLLPGGGWFCGLPADKTEESSYDHLALDLMTMPTDKCVIFQNKLHPICCTKYNITKHPNYKEFVNSDEKDLFTSNKPYIIQSDDSVGSEKIKPFCVFQNPETDPAS